MTAAAIWTVVAWLRWVETGRTAWAVVHGLCLMLALGSKETAVVLPAVLALWSVLGVSTAKPGPVQVPLSEVTLAGRMLVLVRRFRHLVPAALIIKQPDLGNTVLVFLITLAMLFDGRNQCGESVIPR